MKRLTENARRLVTSHYAASGYARLISVFMQFVMVYVATRAAGFEAFGHFATMLSLAMFFAVVCAAGQVGAAYRNLPKILKDGERLDAALELDRIFSLPLYLSPVFGLAAIAAGTYALGSLQSALYMAASAFLLSVLEITSVVLRCYKKVFFAEFLKNAVWRLMLVIILGLALFMQKSPSTPAVSIIETPFLVAVFTGGVLALIFARATTLYFPSLVTPTIAIDRLKIDLRRWLVSSMNAMISNFDVIFVGLFAGATAAAAYFIAVRLSSLPGLILTVTNPVILPIISRIAAGETANPKLSALIRRNTLLNVSATVLASLFIILVGGTLFRFLSDGAEPDFVVLSLLLVGQVINGSMGPTILSSQIFDIQQTAIFLTVISMLLLVLGGVYLVPEFGPMGMAATVLLVRVVQNIGIAIALRANFGFSILSGKVYKN